ncbi:Calpain [Hondaea fermentalgiana]|uniref:Calpain n=1 Tax=Hondaea fermentalgiana TaxID=2315210 RepID=A0A2R5GEK5_9STRA|nr:Calpain [Hondaea fermentalgiana]|eukprot:GBG28739.1 Calpain [Hondaea fermentalgiana]
MLSCDVEAECSSSQGQDNGGNLTVAIIAATGLTDEDGWGPFAGVSDPFVEITIGDVVRQSSVVEESLTPVWPNEGDALEFGAQFSGENMTVRVYDDDAGLELADDLLHEVNFRVPDCACFAGPNNVCDRAACVERVWLPLTSDANCLGRLTSPWDADVADPDAPCLLVETTIQPFRIEVTEVSEIGTGTSVTTASVKFTADVPSSGRWGRLYVSGSFVLDPSWPTFQDVSGGLLLQTNMTHNALDASGTYLKLQTNVDSTIYVFFPEDDEGDAATPGWINDAAGWTNTSVRMVQKGNEDSSFRAWSTSLSSESSLALGYPSYGMRDSIGELVASEMMYGVIAVMTANQGETDASYRTEFEVDTIVPLIREMLLLVLPFVLLQRSFFNKIAWRVDRIENGLLQAAAKDESKNLLSLVLKNWYLNGSPANIDFRRNLYFLTLGAKVTLLAPVALCFSYSLAMAKEAVPMAAGLAVFCVGMGIAAITFAFVTWKKSGWRMSHARLVAFGVGAASIYVFLFLAVCFDMRVIDAGLPFSIFGLSCVAFTLNAVPMIGIYFLDNDQLHQAFAQLQRVVDKNSKLSAVKNKFQALGTMGLKMALLNNAKKAEEPEKDKSSSGEKTRPDKKPFGSLLGGVYTIDDTVKEFSYTDTFRRWFAGGRRKRRRLVRGLYGVALSILFVYSIVVFFKCDSAYRAQGFGFAFCIVLLDTALFALLRGPCMWGTGHYVLLSFAGRGTLALCAGENWLVGIGLAYFIYGAALGQEIINQRMQTIGSDRAGSVAYFGQGLMKRKRVHDVSAMPEFVLAALSFFFLIALLGYVFALEDQESMPSLTVLGQTWDLWIFGVIAFVVVIVSVVLGLARRALMLQHQGLLRTRAYLMYRWISLPIQLVALAELLVVMSGLLFYAMTSSTFVFVSSIFFPLIAAVALRVYMHWCANDFSIFEKASRRGEDPEDGDEEEDGDDDLDMEGDDDGDDEDDDEESRARKREKKRKSRLRRLGGLGDLGDSDSDESGFDDEDDEDQASRTSSFRKSISGNLKALNERLAKHKQAGALAMPKLPFRKPMHHAQKVDRIFDDDDVDDEEEVKNDESAIQDASFGKNEKGATEGDSKDATETHDGGALEGQNVSGQRADGEEDLADKGDAKEAEDVSDPELGPLQESAKSRRGLGARLRCPHVSLRRLLASSRSRFAILTKRFAAKYKVIRAKVVAFLREKLQISEETDPTKMTDVEALWHGKLTAMDYSMLRGIGMLTGLVVLYGMVIGRTEGSLRWGNTIWFVALLLVFSLVPMRKFYGTQQISPDMVHCMKISIALDVIGSLIVFIDVLGASVSRPGALWLLFGLVLWPALLLAISIMLIWRDNSWQLSDKLRRPLQLCFRYFFFCAVMAYIFASPMAGFLSSAFTGLVWVSMQLIEIWAANGFFLPRQYQSLLRVVLNAVSVSCVLAVLVQIVQSSDAIFFSLSLSLLCQLGRLGIGLIAHLATISRSTPIYFSTFVFPVYVLDPISNDLVEKNEIGELVFKMQFVLLLWGVCCTCFIDPLDIGIGLVSFSYVGALTLLSFFVSRTPIWMASATLCVDEHELKEAAKQARHVFEKRRENFEILCEEYEARDREDERVKRELDKFSVTNASKKARSIEYTTRYAAKEMVDVLQKAQRKLFYDRLGKRRRDQALTWKTSLVDAFYTAKGPFAPLMLGGVALTIFEMYRDPASLRRKKRKHGRSSRVLPSGQAAGTAAAILGDALSNDDQDGEDDQLDRLVDELGPGGDKLKISVKDWDMTSANDDLGYVEIDLDELTPDTVHIEWHELDTDNEKIEVTGELQVQVEVANVFGGESGDLDLQVRVIVLRARGLRAADKTGTSDPFCVVECGTFSRRTPVVYKTLDPDWTSARGGGRFTFPPVDDTLQVEIRDKDVLSSDLLGAVDIYLPDLVPGEELVDTFALEGGFGKKRATGHVKLALLLSAQVNEYGLKASKASLQVTVVSAKDLRAADRGGTSDPFCVAKCGLDAFSTSVVKKSLAPRWIESYTFNPDPEATAAAEAAAAAAAEAEEAAFEQVEMLDSWKLYLQLPKLDVALAREYYEETRANALMQMLIVVASEGRKSKEAILFQRFLREYRFKLLANKIEPPRKIFKSKSWATVDVKLVALWLLRLSREQRERFYALKKVFAKEVAAAEGVRMEEDRQLASHSEQLDAWAAQYDLATGRRQLENFYQRRVAREANGNNADESEEPEIVVNAREMLGEIESGKNTKPVKLEGMAEALDMFDDPEFPAGASSVAGIANEAYLAGWSRARAINPKVEVFSGGTDPDDVAQGILHNGWFLSAVAILAASGAVGDEEVDPLIDNLFITKARNDVGAYALRLYKNSQWQLILVDDQFPMLAPQYKTERNAGVAASHSLKFEEMWVSLLEKAYAKSFGTYTMLENGYVHQALKTLTGYDAEEIFLLEATQGPARTRLWEKLQRYSRNGFLMGCGTIANNAANAEMMDSGLVFGAIYAIYQVRRVDGHKLLQLRNPPGAQSEWKGDWGDQSPLWTTRLKHKLGWTDDEDDGTFWMSFDDFCLTFRSLYVCHYYDPRIWRSVTLHGSWSGRTAAGLPTKHNTEALVHRNPQWIIDVQRPVDIHIKIAQIDADGQMVTQPQPFAGLLIQSPARRARHVRYIRSLSRQSLVAWTGHPERVHEKHIHATLQPGLYVLLVATYEADQEGPFEVHIDSAFPVGVAQLYPRADGAHGVEQLKALPQLVSTKTAPPKDVGVESKRASLKQKIGAKAERAAAWAKTKVEAAEVKVESAMVRVDAKLQQWFGVNLETLLPPRRDSLDSNELLQARSEADDPVESMDELDAIQDVMLDPRTNSVEHVLREEEALSVPQAAAVSAHGANTAADLVSTTKEPEPLASVWVEAVDPETSKTYYWNRETGESRWDKP